MKRCFIQKMIVTIFVLAGTFSYTSCDGYLSGSESKKSEISTSEKIVLGKKRENPFANL